MPAVKMKVRLPGLISRLSAAVLLVGVLQTALPGSPPSQGFGPNSVSTPVTRRVNAPFLTSGAPYTPAILWLGKVDSVSNYADVRVDYTHDVVDVSVHIIDRRLWNETTPIAANLPAFDSVSLYFDLSGNVGSAPTLSSYRFEVEVGNNFQVSYRGNGTAW